MFSEKGCLENLKHIVSEHADDENIKNLSMDEIRSTYTKLADNLYHISVSNRLKYKNMLWNIDNLKPEIRSKFQTELFNAWHSVYIKSAKVDPTEDRPEIKKQGSTLAAEVEKSPEIGAKEQTSVITEQRAIDSERQNKLASSENTDTSREMKPLNRQSPVTVPKASGHKYENDWFDKLLDFFAAIIGGVLGIVGR
jgi:hypothetical protein